MQDVATMLSEGADIIDVGGYSTRPGAASVSEDEEWDRVSTALRAICNTWNDIVVSLDTWRSGIAERAVREFGVDIINDVSGGLWDERMYETVARLQTPYILTHTYWTSVRQETSDTSHDVVSDVLHFLQDRMDRLHRLGVADVILDPGFGLGKNVEESYHLLDEMSILQVLHAPVLAGLSRKSMLFKPLGGTPTEMLNATTAANVLALERGADILRVHDVRAAREAIQIVELTHAHSV